MNNPEQLGDTIEAVIDNNKFDYSLFGSKAKEVLNDIDSILILAAGTSYYAGLTAKYWFEDIAQIPTTIEISSEYRYRKSVPNKNQLVITVSQSGETADTLAAIKLAKERKATLIGICNVVGSSISRETHCGSYTHAGPEIGVASTKAFTTQITVLTMIALKLAQVKGTISKYRKIWKT